VGISPQQFEKMKERLGGSRRKPGPLAATQPHSVPALEIILGLDPSLRGTGFGVIRMATPHPVALAHGTISSPGGWERSRCLAQIGQKLREVIKAHQPTVCAIEGLFYAQNLQTALIMGEARGAALAAIAESGIEIFEIAPRKVKQAIVGYGAAQKEAVAKMVQRILNLAELPAPDAADALALALTYGQTTNRFGLAALKRI
jgi:crossover junction endodeoxyribonuclease RuvC